MIYTEGNAKVVPAFWGTESENLFKSVPLGLRRFWRIWWIHPFLHIILVQFILFFKSYFSSNHPIANYGAARNWIISFPQSAATTFAFSSVFILLLCIYSYSSPSPYSGHHLLLPSFSTSPAVQQLNLNSLSAVTSASQLSQQQSFPGAAVALDQSAAAGQQSKKFRLPLKTVSKSQKYIPKPIPQELGNLKTYSKYNLI